jgi:hypothetical protein
VAKCTELHLQLTSTRYYNYECNRIKGVFSLGFGSYCLRTDGLITVTSLLAWGAIARELMVLLQNETHVTAQKMTNLDNIIKPSVLR